MFNNTTNKCWRLVMTGLTDFWRILNFHASVHVAGLPTPDVVQAKIKFQFFRESETILPK